MSRPARLCGLRARRSGIEPVQPLRLSPATGPLPAQLGHREQGGHRCIRVMRSRYRIAVRCSRGLAQRARRRMLRTVDGHQRRPPCAVGLPAVLRSRAICPKARTACVLSLNATDDLVRHSRRASAGHRLRPPGSAGAGSLGEIALELRDRDQPHPPLRLHGVDRRHDAPVDRLHTDSERFRRLPARVSQRLNGGGLNEPRRSRSLGLSPARMDLLWSLLAPPSPARHVYTVQQGCDG